MRQSFESKMETLVKWSSDAIFIILIAISLAYLVKSGNLLVSADLLGGPHAYKVILWSLFSLIVLRPVYKHEYLAAFLFYYFLSESIGTTYYVLFHQFWAEFSIPFLSQIFWGFPILALSIFFISKPKIELNKYIIPFVALIVFWSLLGYHVEFDPCCQPLPNYFYLTPLSSEILDAIWLLTYLFWIGKTQEQETMKKTLGGAPKPIRALKEANTSTKPISAKNKKA